MQDFIEKRQAVWAAADAFDEAFEAEAKRIKSDKGFACVTITGARQTVVELLEEGRLPELAQLDQARKDAWKAYTAVVPA